MVAKLTGASGISKTGMAGFGKREMSSGSQASDPKPQPPQRSLCLVLWRDGKEGSG